jgi:hypothetical protein
MTAYGIICPLIAIGTVVEAASMAAILFQTNSQCRLLAGTSRHFVALRNLVAIGA